MGAPTVTSVAEIGHGKRRATWPLNYNVAVDEPEREWTHTYRVRTSSATMNAQQMLYGAWAFAPTPAQLAAGMVPLPSQWTQHPTDPAQDMLASDFAVEETETPECWIVTVTYKLLPAPTDEPGVMSVSTGQTERVIEQDVNGAALVNSCGDPMDPPPSTPEGHLVLRIKQNFAAIDRNDIVTNYLFHTNATSYLDHPAGQVWLADFSAELQYRNGNNFWAASFTFHVRARGWLLKLLNCGYRRNVYILGVLAGTLIIRDQGGQPVSQPALLAADGTALPAGGVPTFVASPNGFTVYSPAEFNNLGLRGRFS